jgi:peptidoglycan pentaglycine glycine transferase (the first glycine)
LLRDILQCKREMRGEDEPEIERMQIMSTDHTLYVLRTVPVAQREAWNRFVAEHPQGHVLQSWEWGELKATTGWQPLRIALWNRQTQHIVAGAQVLRRGAPHIPLWAGHLAYVPKGPLLDWSQAESSITFCQLLDHCLRRQGALALRIEPGLQADTSQASYMQKYWPDLCASPVPPVQPLRTIMLDLQASEDELRARMKEKWRYNIGLATRRGVQVRVASTLADVQAWYRLLQVTAKRDQFGIHTLDYYVQAWQLLSAQERTTLLLAEYEGQLLAGIFVTLFAHEAIYLYGASSNEHRNLMPNYLLQWEAIRWARQRGALRYDLWGIPATDDETEAMAGVYRFKRGWGGDVVSFIGCFERVYHPLTMNIARRFL